MVRPSSTQKGGNYFSSASNYGPYVDLQLDGMLPPIAVLENQLYDGQFAGPYVTAATGDIGVSPTPTQPNLVVKTLQFKKFTFWQKQR